MQDLPHRVLTYIHRHQLLKPGDRVGVAVSGGADSVALLRLMLQLREELGTVLAVVHFNHQLRGPEALEDEHFAGELAARHQLQFHRQSGDVSAHAAARHSSIEAAAREMRYAFFDRLLGEDCVDRIATGHTLDDQAETVLLRITRGAGTRGLAGIYPKISRRSSVPSLGSGHVENSRQEKAIIRPLLEVRRRGLEAYLQQLGQAWREDKSNRDLRFARNRVRHGILPRLEKSLNPAVREALAETAEIARDEEQYWRSEVETALPGTWDAAKNSLHASRLAKLPLALQRRVVRAAAESLDLRLEFRHVQEILEVAAGPAKSVALPGDWAVSRAKDELRFVPQETGDGLPSDYEYTLPVPGRVAVREAGVCFEAALVPADARAGYNRGNLLNPDLLAKTLRIRNWRPGDRFWPAHTKSPKKVKELLQERHVAGPERRIWPVVVSANEVVWLRGFPGPAKLQPQNGRGPAVILREVALADSDKERVASYESDPES